MLCMHNSCVVAGHCYSQVQGRVAADTKCLWWCRKHYKQHGCMAAGHVSGGTCSFFPNLAVLSVSDRSTEYGLASAEPFCLHSSATCIHHNR